MPPSWNGFPGCRVETRILMDGIYWGKAFQWEMRQSKEPTKGVISAGVWLQPAPTESSGTQTTPQSQPLLGPGNQPSVPSVSSWLWARKQSMRKNITSREGSLYLTWDNSEKGAALSWPFSIFIVAIILCFVPRCKRSYFQSLNISSLKKVKILL